MMKYWNMLTEEGQTVALFIILLAEAFLIWG